MTDLHVYGGYVLWARQWWGSKARGMAPCAREMFRFLVENARWDGEERGTIETCTADIQEALGWMVGNRKMAYSRTLAENGMKALRKAGMITTLKTARGVRVTICNYDRYQSPESYERRTENAPNAGPKTPRTPDERRTFPYKEIIIKQGEEPAAPVGKGFEELKTALEILTAVPVLKPLSWEQWLRLVQNFRGMPGFGSVDWVACAEWVAGEAELRDVLEAPRAWIRSRLEMWLKTAGFDFGGSGPNSGNEKKERGRGADWSGFDD